MLHCDSVPIGHGLKTYEFNYSRNIKRDLHILFQAYLVIFLHNTLGAVTFVSLRFII